MIDEILKKYYGLSFFTVEEFESYFVVITHTNTFLLYRMESILDFERCYKLSKIVDYTDSFVVNCFSSIVTIVDSYSYVLIHSSIFEKYEIPLFSFYSVDEIIHLEWRNLWMQRSDYFLSLYRSARGKFSFIDESIHYYVGLLEMAICFLKDYDNYYDMAVVQHQHFSCYEYRNPLNLTIDIKERDFSEYLKYIFFNNMYQNINLEDLLWEGQNHFQYDLVIARLLFPNYYFRLVEDVILGKREEICLLSIIIRVNEYEDYLKKIISIVEKFYSIKKYPIL